MIEFKGEEIGLTENLSRQEVLDEIVRNQNGKWSIPVSTYLYKVDNTENLTANS